MNIISAKANTENVIIAFANRETYGDHLDSIVHKDYLDLVIVFKELVQSDEEVLSRVITYADLEMMKMSIEELNELAKANSRRLLPPELKDFFGMSVLTNENMLMGASAILYSDLLEQVAELFGDDVYLIPSSIHEFIAVPATGLEADALVEMIQTANGSVVRANEVLSDHPYLYKRQSKELLIA